VPDGAAAAPSRCGGSGPSPLAGWGRWRSGWPAGGHPGGGGPPASGGKPAWWVLEERGFALLLVSARHGKLLAGRKADVGDAAWLAELLECGRLRASFVPRPRSVSCATPARERQRLVQAHAAEASASRRTLEDAGTKLDSVATGVGGASGRAMLAALVAGERDPGVLAGLARGRLRAKLPRLRQALRGRFGGHPGAAGPPGGAHLGAAGGLDRRARRAGRAGARPVRPRPGTGWARLPGWASGRGGCVLAGLGVGMAVFPTAAHLASWAGRCPGGTTPPGGERRSGKPTRATGGWVGC
jgi:transposase